MDDAELPERVGTLVHPSAPSFVMEDSADSYETSLVERPCPSDDWPRGVQAAVSQWLAGAAFERRRAVVFSGLNCHSSGFPQREPA